MTSDGTVTEEYSTCDGCVTERIFENILTLI